LICLTGARTNGKTTDTCRYCIDHCRTGRLQNIVVRAAGQGCTYRLSAGLTVVVNADSDESERTRLGIRPRPKTWKKDLNRSTRVADAINGGYRRKQSSSTFNSYRILNWNSNGRVQKTGGPGNHSRR